MWFKVLVACVPAAIVGILFDDILEAYLYNYVTVSIALIVFGVAFLIIEEKNKEGRIIYKLNRIAEQQYLIAEQHSYFNLQYAKLCFDEANSGYAKCRTILNDRYLNSIEKIERIEYNTRSSDKYLNEIDDLLNVKKTEN